MKKLSDPEIQFSKWKNFKLRDRLSEERDVPPDFGILGVYLLTSPLPRNRKLCHLSPEVIYIGMSNNITGRLDKSHHAVRRYKAESGDKSLDNLYYSEWPSDWSNWHQDTDIGKARLAFIKYTERRLIWEYAKKYHRLPRYNKD
jgi:hypothetical protein